MPSYVAVVEHQPTVRTALRTMLRSNGYEIALFGTAKEFLESLVHKHPDCLVLELNMPGRSGLDIVSRLRAEQVVIPTIVITGSEDQDLEKRALQLGVRTVLRTPFLDDLVAAIESGLQSKVG